MLWTFRHSLWIAAFSTAAFAPLADAAAEAAIIAYTFAGASNTDPAHRVATEVAEGVTASKWTNGPGMWDYKAGEDQGTIFRKVGDDYAILQRGTGFGPDAEHQARDQDAALELEVYYQFTVTPDAGQPLSVATLTFDTLWFNGNPNATVFVRSSVDNFATNLGSFLIDGDKNTRKPRVIQLPPEFQNLTDPLTFRFYMFAVPTAANPNGNTAGLDNIQLMSIPEPSGLGLIGLGGLLLMHRPRREA